MSKDYGPKGCCGPALAIMIVLAVSAVAWVLLILGVGKFL